MDSKFSQAEFEQEVTKNILPFWMTATRDTENGGFFGSINNDMKVDNSAERSAVLYSRILWTYSRAFRLYNDAAYMKNAQYPLEYIRKYLLDPEYGGVYWSVDQHGKPVNNRKHTYAQAFTIYGLSEYAQASREDKSLQQAKELFRLIEQNTHDPVNGGNLECRTRQWQAEEDMRLSKKDMNCAKSMNTLLHLMEAYTNLIKVWPDEKLISIQTQLVNDFLTHVIDASTNHLKLFFNESWKSLADIVSYGHDIEASWLLVEAAETLQDAKLVKQTKEIAVKIAQAVYTEGRNPDGGIYYEREATRLNEEHHWWVHAEAVVGFYNAYQISGQRRFAEASERCWEYIQQHFVDHKNGDWFKVLTKEGVPSATSVKVGPWECPYHHSRLCFEMAERLK